MNYNSNWERWNRAQLKSVRIRIDCSKKSSTYSWQIRSKPSAVRTRVPGWPLLGAYLAFLPPTSPMLSSWKYAARACFSAVQIETAKYMFRYDKIQRSGTGHDMTGQDRIGHDRTWQDRTGQDRTGQDRTGQDRTGQDRTGQDRTRQDKKFQRPQQQYACNSTKILVRSCDEWLTCCIVLSCLVDPCAPLRGHDGEIFI